MNSIINRLRRASKETFFLKDLLNEAADYIEKLTDERNTLRNELCLKCNGYKERYLSPCDSCRWKDGDYD